MIKSALITQEERDPRVLTLSPILEDALGQLQIGQDHAPALMNYLQLLLKWNQTYNLTAVREPEAMLSMHLLDCLATASHISRSLTPTTSLIDVGSGAGLPGVLFAILWPHQDMHLVDTVGKKAAFLNQCKLSLGLNNLHVHHSRIEKLKLPSTETARAFTCRAFASLKDFVAQTWHLSTMGSQWFALKGQIPTEEIEELRIHGERSLNTVLQLDITSLAPPRLETTQRHLICIKR